MKGPLQEYIAKQLGAQLKKHKIVVWYDPRSEFAPFVAELREEPTESREGLLHVKVGESAAWLVEYAGSFLEVRKIVEPLVDENVPEWVLIYVPGVERDPIGSLLMELESAGETYQPQLVKSARSVLRPRYTAGMIDEMAPEGASYETLVRACAETSESGPPSILKVIFNERTGSDDLLAQWLADSSRDAEIETKNARRELEKLIHVRIGLDLPKETPLPKIRTRTLRYVLLAEFRADLRGSVPEGLESVPEPAKKDELTAVRAITRHLRSTHGKEYPALADPIERELGLAGIEWQPGALGSVDTFRFGERRLLEDCGACIVQGKHTEALAIVAERENSFWLTHNVQRKAQWEACRRMAELGKVAAEVLAANGSTPKDAAGWIEAYTQKGGLYRLDQAQRRLETWVAHLEEDPQERPLSVVRRAYEDACSRLADRFCRALERAQWSVPGVLQQTHIYPEIVAARPKPVAYFLIDALRFEMGIELAERLPKAAEVTIRPALGSLPSITPIGMAALLPGASASFSVGEANGKLGAKIEGVFLPDLGGRQKLLAASLPGAVDLALDELLSLQPSKLAKKIDGAPLVLVRSQEIDHAGEGGFTFQARQVMDTVIDNLARAIKKLAAQGIEHSIVTADHGHLFFPTDRDESMKIASPGGKQVALHRRCWIGRGGATPPGCIRVTAADLGYESDLGFVFPIGTGVFKAGGDLAYYHGGPSLQELVIPVLGIRLKLRKEERGVQSPVLLSGMREEVTNRIFSVVLKLDGLFPTSVRPLLLAEGQQVGAAEMVINADFDRATGTLTLVPGEEATVAFILSGEGVTALRIVVLDPATDAVLYQSPKNIPVRLGV
jgi:hypothetical protein